MPRMEGWIYLMLWALLAVGNEASCDCKQCSCCFVPSSSSCAHYCFCPDSGSPLRRKCPGKQLFNPQIMNCDDPDNFNCSDVPDVPKSFRCDPTKEEEYHPYRPPTRCDLYITCSHGYPRVQPCPAGLHWCQECQQCQYPENANCDITLPTTSARPTTARPTTATFIPPTAATSDTPVAPPTGKPLPCVHGRLYPHPGRCNWYYVCNINRMELRECPARLHFCTTCLHQGCVFPRDSDCMLRTPVSPQLPALPKRVEMTSPQFAGGHDSESRHMRCPLPDGAYEVAADPALYLLCRAGQGAFARCPPGTAFRDALNACVPFDRALTTAQCGSRPR